jgi:type IV pilus assembly protein PilB
MYPYDRVLKVLVTPNDFKRLWTTVEYMQLNTEIRQAISLQYPVAQLRSIALDSGLTTMRDSALNHVIEGLIPLAELPRILPTDRMAPEKRGAR